MRVQDLMTDPAITCHVDDDLDVTAKVMRDHDCAAIPAVGDGGKLAGMNSQPRVQKREAV